MALTIEDVAHRNTITVEEAGALIGRSRPTAYRLAASGELPGVRRLGARYVVVTAELLEWLGVAREAS